MLLIDAVTLLDYAALNTTSNEFVVTPDMYGAPGWKVVAVRAWNNVSLLPDVSRTIRIAESITNLDVGLNFTLSSSQALPSRPMFVLPVMERIDFTAIVSPNASGYLYNWTINGTTVNLLTPDWFYTFPSTGIYWFSLVADGCNNLVFEKYLEVISPIEDFNVSVQPFADVLVNRTTSIHFTYAKHSECLKLEFGDGSLPRMQCKSDITHNDMNCFTENSTCQVSHVYASRGNFTVKVTAMNGLFARVKETTVAAKHCFYPVINMQGMT